MRVDNEHSAEKGRGYIKGLFRWLAEWVGSYECIVKIQIFSIFSPDIAYD